MEKLIADYRFELAEAACAPGAGRYGVQVTPADDISAALPYLNAVLEDTLYDHENQVLIGAEGGQRYAFRPHEIRVSGIVNAADARGVASHAVDRVNDVWERRQEITPSYRERTTPATVDIFQLLPRTNCKKCGYATCLAFAADARHDPELVGLCQPLAEPGRAADVAQIRKLLAGD